MRFPITVLLLAATLTSAPAWSAWTLDNTRSRLTFVSIKNNDVAEIHRFEQLSGHVADDGRATVTIALDSLETAIPIRNERMRDLLFDTAQHKEATLTAQIDRAAIDKMAVGEVGELAGEGTLVLRGQAQPLTLRLQVAKVTPQLVVVASKEPLIVNAAPFGLNGAIEQLREIAGLSSIGHTVPVTFVLTFVAP